MNWAVPSDRRVRRHRAEIVDELNRLMAEEAEAGLRYFQLRFRLRGVDRNAAEPFFVNGLRETLEHAEAIANQIRALGETPRLHINLSLSGGSMRLEDALAEALDVEQQALDAYKDFLPRVADDPVLEDFIRRQIELETQHVQEIVAAIEAGGPLKLIEKPEP
jgi:bacterioferritin (cytochrome b1)